MSRQDATTLHGVYKGGTVVVVGNAPSLNETDLATLSKFPTIGCNRILQHPTFRPTYLMASDRRPYRLEIESGTYKRHADEVNMMFSTTIYDKEIHCHGADVCEKPDFRWFSWRVGMSATPFNWKRFDEKLCSFGSISGPMIQAAVIMGAKRIVIVGIDMEAPSKPGSIHFYKNEGEWEGKRNMSQIQPGGKVVRGKSLNLYRQAFDELHAMGINIYNLSPWHNTRFSQVFGYTEIGAFMKRYG